MRSQCGGGNHRDAGSLLYEGRGPIAMGCVNGPASTHPLPVSNTPLERALHVHRTGPGPATRVAVICQGKHVGVGSDLRASSPTTRGSDAGGPEMSQCAVVTPASAPVHA